MNQFKADCIDEKQILIRILSIRFTSFVQGRERFLVFTATGLTLLINLTLSIVWNNNRITAKQSQNLVSLCYNNPQELDLVYYHIFNDKSGVSNLEWRNDVISSHMDWNAVCWDRVGSVFVDSQISFQA